MSDVEFTAYFEDSLVHAMLDLPEGQRLTDLLNESSSIDVTSVRLIALDDGRSVELDELELDVAEICALVPPAQTGSIERRIRTRTARVEIEVGPYEILGHLHGPTSGDPLLAVRRRKPMIPLTDATIAYSLAGQTRMSDVDVMVINRDRALVVKPVTYERSKIDDIGLVPVDPNAKDLTHELSIGLRDF